MIGSIKLQSRINCLRIGFKFACIVFYFYNGQLRSEKDRQNNGLPQQREPELGYSESLKRPNLPAKQTHPRIVHHDLSRAIKKRETLKENLKESYL